jgi:hypothetical protein
VVVLEPLEELVEAADTLEAAVAAVEPLPRKAVAVVALATKMQLIAPMLP